MLLLDTSNSSVLEFPSVSSASRLMSSVSDASPPESINTSECAGHLPYLVSLPGVLCAIQAIGIRCVKWKQPETAVFTSAQIVVDFIVNV